MTNVELEFLGAIYLLYGNECIHWLRTDEVAYSRTLTGGWRTWQPSPASFTLLKRRPAVANLLPFRAGFIRVARQGAGAERTLRRVDRELARSPRWLALSACAEALLMLLVLPATIATQALHYAWLPLLIAFLIVHASTVWWFFASYAPWRAQGPHGVSPVIAVVLNPMAAIRSSDALTQAMFDAGARS
jgi:hypothetical protein